MGNVDKRPLISVIVPVYKVEQYLHACVDSILAQTYTNLEIILVNDGSPDNCPAICDEYAAKDHRIKVIHKENGGLSDARNAGLATINGEYLMFVDSDDILSSNAVSTLYNLAVEYDAELAIGGHKRFSDNIEQNSDVNWSSRVHCMTKTEAMKHMLQNGCASWGRLYRTDIHKSIFFPIGEINEDEAIVLNILDRCNKAVITDECVYHYRTRPESITTSSFSLKKLDWYRHCKTNLEWIRENYPELEVYAADRYRSSILYSLHELSLFDQFYEMHVNELLADLKINRGLFKKTPSSRSDRLRIFMLSYFSFGLYRFIMRRRYRK